MSDPHHHEHSPDCGHHHEHGHDHGQKDGSKKIIWAAAIAAVVGIGAYLISKYGEKGEKSSAATPPDGAWQARIDADQPADKSR